MDAEEKHYWYVYIAKLFIVVFYVVIWPLHRGLEEAECVYVFRPT